MRRRALAIAVSIAVPLMTLAVWSTGRTIREFSDPCVYWGASQPAPTLAPGGPCPSVRVNGETKARAVGRLIVINGGILVASLLGVLGAWLARPSLLVAGAGLILMESFVQMSLLALAPMLASGLLLLAARLAAAGAGAGLRVVGSLAGVWGLWWLAAALRGGPPGVWAFVGALGLVAAIGWWPSGRPPFARLVI